MNATAPKAAPNTGATPSTPSVPKSAKFVYVGCKIPNGLDLQLCQETVWLEDTPSGPKQRKRHDRFGQMVTLKGPAYPVGTLPKGFARPRPTVIGGFALTKVPADFFEQWMEQNKRNPLVTSGMVFYHGTLDYTKGEAKELKDTLSGLEPLNPDGDRRVARPMTGGVTDVMPADEMKSRVPMQDDELA